MHFLAEGLVVRAIAGRPEYGVFAERGFAKGAMLLAWGGRVVTTAQLTRLSAEDARFVIQIDDDLHLATLPAEAGSADFVNHSCAPNAGLAGQVSLVALREIAAGEEVCCDYATSDSNDVFEFSCGCGAEACRGAVRRDDWLRPEVQARCRGYFSPYLQRRIDRLACESAEVRGIVP